MLQVFQGVLLLSSLLIALTLFLVPEQAAGFNWNVNISSDLAKAICMTSRSFTKTAKLKFLNKEEDYVVPPHPCPHMTKRACDPPNNNPYTHYSRCITFKCVLDPRRYRAAIGAEVLHQSVDIPTFAYYMLYLDINNTNNAGTHTIEDDFEERIVLDYDTLDDRIRETTKKIGGDFSAAIPVHKAVTLTVSGNIGNEAMNKLQDNLSTRNSTTLSSSSTDTLEITANVIYLAYKLYFSGPGVSHQTKALVSSIDPLDNSPVRVNYDVYPIVKEIKVVFTDDIISAPPKAITAFYPTQSGNLNDGFKNIRPAWLVAEYTNNSAERVTDFEFIGQGLEQAGYTNINEGGELYIYIKHRRNYHLTLGVTRPILFRSEDDSMRPDSVGLNACTGDINKGRRGHYLALCWTWEKIND